MDNSEPKLLRLSIAYDNFNRGWRVTLLDAEKRIVGKSNHVFAHCDDIWLSLAAGPIDIEVGYE